MRLTLLAACLLGLLALPSSRPSNRPSERVGNVRAMIEAMLLRRAQVRDVRAPCQTYQVDLRTKENLEVLFSPGDVEWLGGPRPLGR